MKVSVITAVRNGKEHIDGCIDSVLLQDYPGIEYVVVDGASTDGTLEIARSYGDKISRIISEPDKGIYDALNKGLHAATGEIIGFLHADDFYPSPTVISDVVKEFAKTGADAVWGDLAYVDRENTGKTLRLWKSSAYEAGKFRKGWMPPHPAFFVKKEIYSKYGFFRTDMKIAADYELMLRFLEKNGIKGAYIPEILVKMRTGGMSNKSLKNILRANIESYRSWGLNGLKISPLRILLKPLSKIAQYFK